MPRRPVPLPPGVLLLALAFVGCGLLLGCDGPVLAVLAQVRVRLELEEQLAPPLLPRHLHVGDRRGQRLIRRVLRSAARTVDGGMSGFAISHSPSGTVQLHDPAPGQPNDRITTRTRSKLDV